MTNLDIAGHLSYILLAVGMFRLAIRQRDGWWFRFLGEAGWVVLGVEMQMTSIWVWGLFFMLLDINGFVNWRERDKWKDI